MPNLIENLKSIFATKEGGINSSKAKEIQKTHVFLTKKKAKQKELCTPPYLIISEQIYDDNLQVAKAAVFNIAEIVVNSGKYKEDILATLKDALEDEDVDDEIKTYIDEKISYIRKAK